MDELEVTEAERLRMARAAALVKEQVREAQQIADEFSSHGGTNMALLGAILGALASNYLAFTLAAGSK